VETPVGAFFVVGPRALLARAPGSAVSVGFDPAGVVLVRP
jgi:hypothetical protein